MKLGHALSAALYAGAAVTVAALGRCGQTNSPGPGHTINPLDLLPASDEVAGWIAVPNGNCPWEGIASDTTTLFDIFDGPARPYVDNGFVNGGFRGYIDKINSTPHDTIPLCLQLFNQGTSAKALAVFAATGFPGLPYETVTGIGDTARIDTSMTNIILEMKFKTCFVRAIVWARGPSIDAIYKQALMDFAAAVVRRITAAGAV